mgnify:CR=1|tara:strand:- start:812 stop:1042 length:231 start_codon:yes stop_codon:yes gene_type:complete
MRLLEDIQTIRVTKYIYNKILPVYIKIPFSNNKIIAIWNCATRGKTKLTFIQNLKEIRITIRKEGSIIKVLKKGIY